METAALAGELLTTAVTLAAHGPRNVRRAAVRLGDALAPAQPSAASTAVDWDAVTVAVGNMRCSLTALQSAPPRPWRPAHRRARAFAAARLAAHLDYLAEAFGAPTA
jgi:hypothetical protein